MAIVVIFFLGIVVPLMGYPLLEAGRIPLHADATPAPLATRAAREAAKSSAFRACVHDEFETAPPDLWQETKLLNVEHCMNRAGFGGRARYGESGRGVSFEFNEP